MKSSLKVLTVVTFIVVFSIFTKAQVEQADIRIQINKNPVDCNSYLLEKKSIDYIRLIGRGSGEYWLERYLKRFLEQCPNFTFHQKVKEDLKKVFEIMSEHHLSIAKYYLKKVEEEGKGGLMGAYSRLKRITEQYPQYSKMDEVLFLLIKANLYRNETEEAKKYYRQLLDDFPFSNYICEANKLFL